MASNSPNRALWVLGMGLVAALLVIAFLLGRESSRPAPLAEQETSAIQSQATDVTPLAEPTAPERLPSLEGSRFSWEKGEEEEQSGDALPSGAVRIEERPDGTIVLSNVRDDKKKAGGASKSKKGVDTPQSSANSVEAYFAEIEAVQSEQQASDPEAFAMNILKASMSGSTEGLAQLAADTERMEKEIQQITPPASCEHYHQATLEALQESRAVLENLEDAMKRRDIQKIMATAQQAAALQAKTTELKAMEKEIRAQ